MRFYTYILECKDGTLYTGYSNDLDKRVRAHNESKTGAKYTKGKRPVKLVYSKTFKTLSEALKREIQIKNLTRKQKLELIEKNKSKKIK